MKTLKSKPHGSLTVKTTVHGKVKGCFYAMIDESNLHYIQAAARNLKERETTICNNALNALLTKHREEDEANGSYKPAKLTNNENIVNRFFKKITGDKPCY